MPAAYLSIAADSAFHFQNLFEIVANKRELMRISVCVDANKRGLRVNFIARRRTEEIMRSTHSYPTMPATILAAAKRFAVGPGLLAHLGYSPVAGGLGCEGLGCGVSFSESLMPSRNTKLKSTERNALNSLTGTFSVERPELFDFAHPKRM
jgi:hypothetical protein